MSHYGRKHMKKLQGLICVDRTPDTAGDSGGVGQRVECKMIGNGYLLGLIKILNKMLGEFIIC